VVVVCIAHGFVRSKAGTLTAFDPPKAYAAELGATPYPHKAESRDIADDGA
jgi:hypothetical protein